MQTGTLVKLKLFTVNTGVTEPKDIYRYGIVMPQPDEFGKDFAKVMWQPSNEISFGKGRNQCEIVVSSRLEIVCGIGGE